MMTCPTDDYSGHYVIASSWPPERRPLERLILPNYINFKFEEILLKKFQDFAFLDEEILIRISCYSFLVPPSTLGSGA